MFGCRQILIALMVLAPYLAKAEDKVQTVSSKPVASPSGRYTAIVDRLLKIVDNEPDEFSGAMLLRITSSADSAAVKQQYLEGTQVRTLEPPSWLDDSWCAYTYNVAKNANGIVYLNAETGEGYQVELVAPPRRMAASGTVEQEVTSLDVTVLGTTASTHIHNVPWRGGSAFPLRLGPLPRFEKKPFGKDFLDELARAVGDYQALCAQFGLNNVDVEQASESFSPDEKHAALLACADGVSYLGLVGLEKDSSSTKLLKLDADMKLNCLVPAPQADSAAQTPATEPTAYSRYTTAWKDDNHAQVEREVFSTENDTSYREVDYVADLTGTLKKLERPAPPPKAAAETEGRPKEKEKDIKVMAPKAATSPLTTHTRPLLQVTTRKREPATRKESHTAPEPTPEPIEPSPTPASTPAKKGFLFDGILPRRSKAPPSVTPIGVPEVQKTPSD